MTMDAPVLTPEQMVNRLFELNREKRILQKKQNISKDPDSYAPEWARLAGEYALIDAKANTAFCMDQYNQCTGTKPEVVRMEVAPLADQEKAFIPEPELPDEFFDWQGRADMGD